MERNAATGGWSGRVPCGYRVDHDRGTLTINADAPPPTSQQIADAHAHLQHALTNGGDQQRKALLQLLIADVQVAGRDHISARFTGA
jgi:hypothetical protein